MEPNSRSIGTTSDSTNWIMPVVAPFTTSRSASGIPTSLAILAPPFRPAPGENSIPQRLPKRSLSLDRGQRLLQVDIACVQRATHDDALYTCFRQAADVPQRGHAPGGEPPHP